MLGQLGAAGTRIFPQVCNPSREAHERRAELVGRFPRHGDPEAVARRGDLRAERPTGDQRQAQEHRAFQRGDTRKPPRRGSGAVVDRAHARLDQWGVLDVERGDPRPQPGRVRPDRRRRVVERGNVARRVHHDDGDTERADLAGEVQQRVGRGVGSGIVQSGEHPAEQRAGLARVVAQVTRHHPCVPDGDPAEQQRQPRHDGRTRPAERGVTCHRRRGGAARGAPARGTGPAPREPSRSRRAAGASRAAPRWCAAAPPPTR